MAAIRTRRMRKPNSLRSKLFGIVLISVLATIWVLPVVLFLVVGELPYLYQYSFTERFIFVSLLMGLILVAAAAPYHKQTIRNWRAMYAEKSAWQRTKEIALGLLGLMLFNSMAAAMGGNVLGAGVKLLPGQGVRAIVEVTGIEHKGVRYRAANLIVRDISNGRIKYLNLARRHFDYSKVGAGSVLALDGKKGFLGTYIDDFQIVPKEHTMELSNSLMAPDAQARLSSKR
jgi:hypothetical protein